jgi:DNA-binding XRE family transcriptional regulator
MLHDLRTLRRRHAMTLAEAAAGILHPVSLCKIEQGQSEPRPATIRQLAQRYHTTTDDIWQRWRVARRRWLTQQRDALDADEPALPGEPRPAGAPEPESVPEAAPAPASMRMPDVNPTPAPLVPSSAGAAGYAADALACDLMPRAPAGVSPAPLPAIDKVPA